MAVSGKKVSYYAKEESKCPICEHYHSKEEMLSGGGRLIAGNLGQDLRRAYKPSPKFGVVIPLAYSVQVCPNCLYASYSRDFATLKPNEIEAIAATQDYRRQLIQTLFGDINFEEPRDLVLGTASLLLAIDCYHLRGKEVAPTVKKAVSSIRVAWLLDDLFAKAAYRPYDKVRDFYFMQAASAYLDVLEIMQSGKEPLDQATYMLGPDLDHNWGYDGIIYLNSYLTRKYIDKMANTDQEKFNLLDKSKRYLSKLYGTGKSNKSKPNVIVDMAKDLYDEIGELLDELEKKLEPDTPTA